MALLTLRALWDSNLRPWVMQPLLTGTGFCSQRLHSQTELSAVCLLLVRPGCELLPDDPPPPPPLPPIHPLSHARGMQMLGCVSRSSPQSALSCPTLMSRTSSSSIPSLIGPDSMHAFLLNQRSCTSLAASCRTPDQGVHLSRPSAISRECLYTHAR